MFVVGGSPYSPAGVKNGMLDLKAYACILLEQGLTSVEEVMSVVSVQE